MKYSGRGFFPSLNGFYIFSSIILKLFFVKLSGLIPAKESLDTINETLALIVSHSAEFVVLLSPSVTRGVRQTASICFI